MRAKIEKTTYIKLILKNKFFLKNQNLTKRSSMKIRK